MDQVIKNNIVRIFESARSFANENPIAAWITALALVSAAHLFFKSAPVKKNPSDCVIVITGCDSGFGLATCKRLHGLGYRVVAGCLHQESADRLKGEVDLPIKCDVTDEADVKNLVHQTQELMAHKKAVMWALINNAGIANAGGLDWVASSSLRKVMEVNFFALFEVTRAFLPLLKQTKDSRVINVSSGAGLSGFYNMGMYCASKHAVEGLGKVLRQELAPWNIHVAHINPGFMNTPILQKAIDGSLRDLEGTHSEVAAQYSLHTVHKLKDNMDKMMDDPEKAVNKILEQVTAAKPLFNNPVGAGMGTLGWILALTPQRWLWALIEFDNRQHGLGPTPEALERIQQEGQGQDE